MTTGATQRCSRCDDVKPLELFTRSTRGGYEAHCLECERRRVREYTERKRWELGDAEWRDLKAELQRVRRRRTGDPYGRARRQAIRELVDSRPDEYAALRAAAVADGRRQPGAVARQQLARRYREIVSNRTRQLTGRAPRATATGDGRPRT